MAGNAGAGTRRARARGHAGTVALDAARPRRIPATLLTPRC